ncbi:MAG: winged helix-turn-helix transcriptional regulator [Methylobacteriaceae bacterium]|nr:winged helix-turn-helix transcriptional regulator [Methylobacteriaceae bacterium]
MVVSSLSPSELIQRIGTAISRWQDATARFDEAIGERLHLSTSERQCLALLTQGPHPARHIAEATRLTRAAITTLVDRLEARKLVRRTADKHDRRQVLISMTPMAERLTAQYYGPIAAKGTRFLASFTHAELTAILRFVEGALELQLGEIDELARKTPPGP